jgi:hypothetical protein
MRRFKSYSDVRKYIANLINRIEAGLLPAEKATKLCYLANNLIKCLEVQDLERMKADIAEIKREDEEGWYE